jgi:metal-responsive CopG/Arc/MetJ family transcriptional regulator
VLQLNTCVSWSNPVPDSSPTISLRLPKEVRERLDNATARTRRSRSFLMQEALHRHLADIERDETQKNPKRHLATLLSVGGAGKRDASPRTDKDVNDHIRWLRDNG